jgi:membrane protease YdiL (CAAX protease family)
MLIVIIAYYLLVFGLAFVVFNKRFKRDFGALKDNFGTYIKYIFKMWGIMLLFSILAVSVQMLLGVEGDSANQTALQSAPLWYVVPLAVIWAPLVEECLFRGVIRRFIPNNDILFILVSAMSFGLLHTIGQEVTVYMTIVHSLQYAAMGGVMAYVYTRTNNIFSNIGVHFVQNSFSSIVMILMNLV